MKLEYRAVSQSTGNSTKHITISLEDEGELLVTKK